MSDGMKLVLIQSPEVVKAENLRDYNRHLLKAYSLIYKTIPVRDITDFINRVLLAVATERRHIRTLIIGSHGVGLPSGAGHFYIGLDRIGRDDDGKINSLKVLAPFFTKDAGVYIMACRTGHARTLLQKVSRALGGVAVHGYTNWITTTDYIITADVDRGVGDEYKIDPGMSSEQVLVGQHIICWPTLCMNASHLPQ